MLSVLITDNLKLNQEIVEFVFLWNAEKLLRFATAASKKEADKNVKSFLCVQGHTDECSNRMTLDWLERLESLDGLKAPIREYTSASEQAPHDR